MHNKFTSPFSFVNYTKEKNRYHDVIAALSNLR